jgi:alpha-pyrone synthase
MWSFPRFGKEKSPMPMPRGDAGAWLNAVGTATPPHDVHGKFVSVAGAMLASGRHRRLFARMVDRAGIAHRYSVLAPGPDPDAYDTGGIFRRGAFPGTAERMRLFDAHALPLALGALGDLAASEGPGWPAGVSHLVVTCCTGFAAPGFDSALIDRVGLERGVERTLIGFMGCNAAFNGLKLARHIVRSDPRARVLVVSLELCTLHLQETQDLEKILSFLIFADGCATALVSAEPRGLRLDRFASTLWRDGQDLITWGIGMSGFDMHLSGDVPAAIARRLPDHAADLAGQRPKDEIATWAVHPGGRSILDAVEHGLDLAPEALDGSRAVLRDYGNMSSATILFVLKRMLAEGREGPGLAFGFGPGLSVESMAFEGVAA